MAKKPTRAEARLLTYPPTKETWVCQAKKPSLDGSTCQKINAGKYERCWVCGSKKPKRPKKLWPQYVAACKKVGIEPGQSLRPGGSDVPATGKRRVARRRAT